MNRVEELIERLCPDGAEHVRRAGDGDLWG